MGYIDWDTSWANLGTINQTINASSNTVFGTVSNDTKVATEVSIIGTFAAGASSSSAVVQIERDIDGTNFESQAAASWTVPLPFTAASTQTELVITVGADRVGKFRVRVVNDDASNALSSVTVRTRQAVTA